MRSSRPTATPIGPLNVAVDAAPSALPRWPGTPATIVIFPAGSIRLIVLSPVSATIRLPVDSKAIADGVLSPSAKTDDSPEALTFSIFPASPSETYKLPSRNAMPNGSANSRLNPAKVVVRLSGGAGLLVSNDRQPEAIQRSAIINACLRGIKAIRAKRFIVVQQAWFC